MSFLLQLFVYWIAKGISKYDEQKVMYAKYNHNFRSLSISGLNHHVVVI